MESAVGGKRAVHKSGSIGGSPPANGRSHPPRSRRTRWPSASKRPSAARASALLRLVASAIAPTEPSRSAASRTRARRGSCGSGRERAGVGTWRMAGPEQLVQHVLRSGDRDCSVPQKAVRPARHARRDPAGHGGHGPAQVTREVGGDQAPARVGRLHDDGHPREAGHDPVAGREAPAKRLRARRELREHETPLADALVQPAVPARIDDIRPAREHRDRQPRSGEAAAVSGGVDAERQAAHDGHAGRSEPAAERVRHLAAVRARVARADDRHRRLVPERLERLEPTAPEQDRRRVAQLEEQRRIGGRVPAESEHRIVREPLPLRGKVEPVEILDEPPCVRAGDGGEQIGLRQPQQAGHAGARALEQPRDSRRQRRDQEGPPQAGVARFGSDGAHAASGSAPPIR